MSYVKCGSKGSYAIIYKAASAIASLQSCRFGPPEFFSYELCFNSFGGSGRDFSSAELFNPASVPTFVLNGYAIRIVAFGRLGGLLGDLWYMIMDRNPFLH